MSKREKTSHEAAIGQPICKSARPSCLTDNWDSEDSEPLLLPSSGGGEPFLLPSSGNSEPVMLPSFDLQGAVNEIEDFEEAASIILRNCELKNAILKSILSNGDYVLGDFVLGDFVLGDFVPNPFQVAAI